MDARDWASAKQLLADVVDLPPTEQRAYIDAHCSDPTVRRELLAMLESPAAVSRVVAAAAALTPGTRIGVYEIVELIDAGGMGEVYCARDPKLRRDVAIKVLPATIANDRDRLARLEREARLLASLNHPNIAHVYGFEESDGTHALVMELVEGPTLADRIARGPLALDEALSIARQLATALAFAHDHGIVHRDLKPANIKLRPDGPVKVLDFGLARAIDPTSMAQSAEIVSPTATAISRRGVILGTPSYMSPEQGQGKAVDQRADIWAFGAVLFEMLTGRRVFGGDSVTDTLSRVLRDDPDWGLLPTTTPPSIRRLLRRCLEKERDRRLASAADARLEIDDALSPDDRHEDMAAHGVNARAGQYISRTVGATAVLALLAFWAAASFGRLRHEAAPISVPPGFEQLTYAHGVQTRPSISPDGKSVVYVQMTGTIGALYLLHIGSRTPVLLSNPRAADNDTDPAFSPDGEKIAFRSERNGGGIFVMSATGESVNRLTDFGFNPTWSPSGKEIAVAFGRFESPTDLGANAVGLAIIDVASRQRRDLLKTTSVVQPSWSPHGFRLAFFGLRGSTGQRDIWTIAIDGSAPDPST